MKLLFMFLCAASLHAAGTLDIYFIDVDIGNAVLLVTPSGQTMMMDAGSHLPNNRDRDRVLAELKKDGVKKIDYHGRHALSQRPLRRDRPISHR